MSTTIHYNTTLTAVDSIQQHLTNIQLMMEFVMVSLILFSGIAYTILRCTTPTSFSYTSTTHTFFDLRQPREWSGFSWQMPIFFRSTQSIEDQVDEEEGLCPTYDHAVSAYYGNLVYEKPRRTEEEKLPSSDFDYEESGDVYTGYYLQVPQETD